MMVLQLGAGTYKVISACTRALHQAGWLVPLQCEQGTWISETSGDSGGEWQRYKNVEILVWNPNLLPRLHSHSDHWPRLYTSGVATIKDVQILVWKRSVLI